MATAPPDPNTGKPFPRLYHSVAVLLPDGRVFVTGGLDYTVEDGTFGNSEHTGEIFAPPYVNHPDRPSIVSVTPAADVAFGASFEVRVLHTGGHNPAKPIERFVLLRPAAVTHHFDNDQRYIELDFTAGAVDPNHEQSLQVTAPADDMGPPGYYMLFAVRRTTDVAPNHRVPSEGGYFLRLF